MVADGSSNVLADDAAAVVQWLDAKVRRTESSPEAADRTDAFNLRRAASLIRLLQSEVAALRGEAAMASKLPCDDGHRQGSKEDGIPASGALKDMSALAEEVAEISHRILANECHEFAEGREHSPACKRARQEILALFARVRADVARGLPPI